ITIDPSLYKCFQFRHSDEVDAFTRRQTEAKHFSDKCNELILICKDMITAVEQSINIDAALRNLLKESIVAVKYRAGALRDYMGALRGSMLQRPDAIGVGELEIIREIIRKLQNEMDVVPAIQGPTTSEKLEQQMLHISTTDSENFSRITNRDHLTNVENRIESQK
ncbi:hypothetical protein PFISCL1PPCAC_7348, partial [Pristionchus fissidentatus]